MRRTLACFLLLAICSKAVAADNTEKDLRARIDQAIEVFEGEDPTAISKELLDLMPPKEAEKMKEVINEFIGSFIQRSKARLLTGLKATKDTSPTFDAQSNQ